MALCQAGSGGRSGAAPEAGPAIYENALGKDHPHVARRFAKMGTVCCDMGRPDEAESCCKRAVTIQEKAADPIGTAKALENYAEVLRKLKRPSEAAPLEERARTLRETGSKPGPDAPK